MITATVENAFSMDPVVFGEFEWKNNGTGMWFMPDGYLQFKTEYTYTINSSARDKIGNNLQADYISKSKTQSLPEIIIEE